MMEKPIKFVTLDGPVEDESSKFVVNPEAVKALSEVEGRLAVVSIAGLYRTGKSFVLNQLAGKNHGFDIGATVEPCTEGVWMWIIDAKKAHPSLAKDDVTYVLLDTEGLGSYQKTTTHDVKIFSIAVLLSSYFIYNSLGTIDDNAMDKLSLVVELTKYIRAQSGDNERDLGQLSLYFPKFMWLVRDFSLELISEGREITAEDYLEKALLPTMGSDEDIVSKNTIRQTINQAFRERTCFTLKRPVNDEELLQNLESAKEEDFRPEYLEQLKVLLRIIYNNTPPKRLYGHNINGPMLAELATSYVGAINAGGVPTISSAWDSVVRIEGAKALQVAQELYVKKMEELVQTLGIMETEKLNEGHFGALKASVDMFRKKAVGENVRSFEDELLTFIGKHFESVERDNYRKSSEFSQELIKKLFKKLAQHVADGSITTTSKLETEWQSMVREFEKEAKGPAKYVEFVKRCEGIFETARKVAELEVSTAEEKAAKKFNEEKEKAKAEYERLEKLYATIEIEWKKTEEEGKSLKNENKTLISEVAKMEKRVKMAEALEAENAALKQRIAELEPLAKKQAERPAEIQVIAPAEVAEDKGKGKGKKEKKDKKCTVM